MNLRSRLTCKSTMDTTTHNTPRRLAFLVSGKCEPQRTGPREDVCRLASLLADPAIGQCECTSRIDCPDWQAYLTDLECLLKNWNQADQLILYFAGHGITHPALREWCLLFGEHNESELIFSWVLDTIKKRGVTRGIIILDACYSG